ncbi:MAG: SRPBCC family protein, partial [Rhizomicrobium sp.]
VETYRGFIFANFDDAAPPLADYLGRGRTMIDRKLNESPVGEIAVRPDPHVVTYRGNWKFQSENIVDGYHFMRVHKGFAALQEKYGDSTGDFGVHKGGTQAQMRRVRARVCSWGCPEGHGVCENPFLDLDRLLDGAHGAYYRALLAQHGEQEMQWMYGGNFSCVFPNFGILHHQIRTWRPLGPALTEVTFYTYDLKGAPDAVNEGWLHSQERFYGPAGYGMPDDVEVFALNQQGLAGTAVEWLILERGLTTDTMTNSGDLRGYPSAETPQRAFWRRWQELMAVD